MDNYTQTYYEDYDCEEYVVYEYGVSAVNACGEGEKAIDQGWCEPYVSNAPPTVNITNCPPPNTTDWTFYWIMADDQTSLANLEVIVYKDGTPESIGNGAESYEWNNIPESGPHSFYVKITDDGNPPLSTASNNCIFNNVLSEPPGVIITSCTDVPRCGTSNTFTWTLSDPDTPENELYVRVKYGTSTSWENQPQGSESKTISIDQCIDSSYNFTFYVQVTDIQNVWPPQRGDEDNCAYQVYSNEAPSFYFTSIPDRYCNQVDYQEYSISMSDDCTTIGDLDVWRRINNGSWSKLCSGCTDFYVSGLGSGEHIVEMAVVDDCGVQSQIKSFTYEVNLEPLVSFNNCPADPINGILGYTYNWDLWDDHNTDWLEVYVASDLDPGNLVQLANGATGYWWSPVIPAGNHWLKVYVYDGCAQAGLSPPVIKTCYFTAY